MRREHAWLKSCWEKLHRDQDIDDIVLSNENPQFWELNQSGSFDVLPALYM